MSNMMKPVAVGKTVSTQLDHGEYMVCYKLPRCEVCFTRDGVATTNPNNGSENCHRCGTPWPAPTDHRNEQAVRTDHGQKVFPRPSFVKRVIQRYMRSGKL
jgi:hypothetical protein